MSGMTDERALELILECIDMTEDYAHQAHDEAREALDHIAARLRGDGAALSTQPAPSEQEDTKVSAANVFPPFNIREN